MQYSLSEYSFCEVASLVSTFPQAEDFWQKPDALVRCSQEFQVKAVFLEAFFLQQMLFLSAVSHPQQHSNATKDTVVSMSIEVPTKYSLIHNDRIVVLEIRLHIHSPMLYRPALPWQLKCFESR